MRISNNKCNWQNEEFYFTVEDHRGITGKVQLNMRSIINDYNHHIEWEEEENEHELDYRKRQDSLPL